MRFLVQRKVLITNWYFYIKAARVLSSDTHAQANAVTLLRGGWLGRPHSLLLFLEPQGKIKVRGRTCRDGVTYGHPCHFEKGFTLTRGEEVAWKASRGAPASLF